MKKSDISKQNKSGRGWSENKDSSGVAPNHSYARKYGYSPHIRKKAKSVTTSTEHDHDSKSEKQLAIYQVSDNEYVVTDEEGNYERLNKEEILNQFAETEKDKDALDEVMKVTGNVILSFIPGGQTTAEVIELKTGKNLVETSIEQSPRKTVKRKDISTGEKVKRISLNMATGGLSGFYYGLKEKK